MGYNSRRSPTGEVASADRTPGTGRGHPRPLCLCVLAAIVAALTLPNQALGATRTLTPVADTYAQSDQPDTAHGSSVRFSTQSGSQTRRAFLRFDVPLA